MTVIELLRIALLVVWFVSPPFLILVVLFVWRHKRHTQNSTSLYSIAIGLTAVASWVVFMVLLFKSETPYGVIFQTSPLTHGLLILSFVATIASLTLRRWKWGLLLANLLVVTLWVAIAYAPSHWLKAWNYGSITINGRRIPASVYIGNPTDSEAEAIVLVHIPTVADYFLSFGEEKVRIAPKREYVRVPGGVWSFRSMRDMTFTDDPLPSKQNNEFRIASPKGDVIAVQF